MHLFRRISSISQLADDYYSLRIDGYNITKMMQLGCIVKIDSTFASLVSILNIHSQCKHMHRPLKNKVTNQSPSQATIPYLHLESAVHSFLHLLAVKGILCQ